MTGLAGVGAPKNTLSYWNLLGGGDGVRMIAMENAYQQAHPNVALDAVVLAWGNPYYTKLSLATLGKKPPDVAISHLTRASILARAGMLEPLTMRAGSVRPDGREFHAQGVEYGTYGRDPVRHSARYAPAGDVLPN